MSERPPTTATLPPPLRTSTRHVLFKHLTLPSFASIPSRDGYYILHLPRQASARCPLGWAPGLLYTTPHLGWCLTVLLPHPSGVWELSLQSFLQWFSVFFCGAPHRTFSCGYLWSRHQRELLSYQNPRDKHLSPESPLPRLILLLLRQLFERPPAVRFRVVSLGVAIGL